MKAISTSYKALQVNLESPMYGTFAEIGAGQEVARFFFQAGGASQTIAKSISAYDMTFSDSIYGKEESKRYVCQSRLKKMLDYEYKLLVERLDLTRGATTRFFVLADTVATKSYFSNNDGHGWMGVMFQDKVNGTVHEIHVHLRLLDSTPLAQQEALGIFGVNLIHAASFSFQSSEQLLDNLMDNLGLGRVELNMIYLSGAQYEKVDLRLLNLELVKKGLTNAVLFNEDGQVVLAADELYKKIIQVVRGSYRPPTLVNVDMISSGKQKFAMDLKKKPEDITTICEITTNNLGTASGFDAKDFLARVDLLAALKQKVLISNFPQYYKLVNYFIDLKAKNIALILGGYNFKQIFDSEYHKESGGVFAALGALFKENVRVYVYPYKDEANGQSVDIENLEVEPHVTHLLNFLKQNSSLSSLYNINRNLMHIYSRRVLNMIQENTSGWKEMVPEIVAKKIIECGFFVKK
jgi:hypothetical protein